MAKFFAWFSKRNKAVAAWVGANLTWCQLIAAQDGGFTKITGVEWVALAIANATALGVYQATNSSAAPTDAASTDSLSVGTDLRTVLDELSATSRATTLDAPLPLDQHAS